MNERNAPRKRAVVLVACLALSGSVCCTPTEQGNASAAESNQSQESQGEDSSPNYSSILQETKTALKKAQGILMEYQGQCSDEVSKSYRASIKLLKTQTDKLKSLENRIDDKKTEVHDQIQSSAKQKDEFKKYFQQPTGKADKEWLGYELYVLQWRNLKYQLVVIDSIRADTKSLLKLSAKLDEQFTKRLSVCRSNFQ